MHLHGCVAAGRRQTANYKAEPKRERPLVFHLVQVPGVSEDTLETSVPKREAPR